MLATIVAVTLAYQANNGLPFVPQYTLYLQMANASEVTRNVEVHMGGALVGYGHESSPRATPPGSRSRCSRSSSTRTSSRSRSTRRSTSG